MVRDEVPMGARNDFSRMVRELVEVRRDRIWKDVAEDDELQRAYLRTIRTGLQSENPTNRRTAMDHYRYLTKLADREMLVVHQFLHTFGVKSESELHSIVEAYKSAGDGDTLTAIERMTSALEALLPLHEEHRGMVVRRLGGYVPVHPPKPDRLEKNR